MSLGPRSRAADTHYLAAFARCGPRLRVEQLLTGEVFDQFVEVWLDRAAGNGWIERAGEHWMLTNEGGAYWAQLCRDKGEISIGLPTQPPSRKRLLGRAAALIAAGLLLVRGRRRESF